MLFTKHVQLKFFKTVYNVFLHYLAHYLGSDKFRNSNILAESFSQEMQNKWDKFKSEIIDPLKLTSVQEFLVLKHLLPPSMTTHRKKLWKTSLCRLMSRLLFEKWYCTVNPFGTSLKFKKMLPNDLNQLPKRLIPIYICKLYIEL